MTRTLAVLLVSSALLAPTLVSAQTAPAYRNKGECEAALKQMRNDERAASPLNRGLFNKTFKAEDGRACTPVTDANGDIIGYEITGGGPVV